MIGGVDDEMRFDAVAGMRQLVILFPSVIWSGIKWPSIDVDLTANCLRLPFNPIPIEVKDTGDIQ